jgi:endoglucanase
MGKRRLTALASAGLMWVVMAVPSLAAQPEQEGLFVPPPNHGAKQQIADLTSLGDKTSAGLIRDMIQTPQAVWFTAGTPKTVLQDVRLTVQRAAAKKTVPVLVAYNIPFRDCAQFSAGGATTVAEYLAWIDAFASGIGNHEAIIILEPDGLGIIPLVQPIRHPAARVVPAGGGGFGDRGFRPVRHAQFRCRPSEGAAQHHGLPRRDP